MAQIFTTTNSILESTGWPEAVRSSAIAFFLGGEALAWWCGIARLDPDVVMEYARPLLGDTEQKAQEFTMSHINGKRQSRNSM